MLFTRASVRVPATVREGVSYLQKGEVGFAELGQDVVDLSEEVVCAEKRTPAAEDGVCDLQDTVVDLGVVGGEARDEVVDQSVPALPEVRVGNDADGLSKLSLDGRRHRDHEADNLTLDSSHLILRELVVSIFVGPAAADEILEEESGRQPCCVGV